MKESQQPDERVERIEWRDHSAQLDLQPGWTVPHVLESALGSLMTIVTVGWVLHETDDVVIIAPEWRVDGETLVKQFIVLLKVAIVKRTPLRQGETAI